MGHRPRGPQPGARAGHRAGPRVPSQDARRSRLPALEVFKKVCAQCHKIYGEGQEVGPEITLNGRGSYEQLLSNVFDPSLVIGAAYQATTVATTDGRVLDRPARRGEPAAGRPEAPGRQARDRSRASQVEEMKVSPLSLMPEDLEKQLKPQELADLFAFITLDKPPGDLAAKPLPARGRSLDRPLGAEWRGEVKTRSPGRRD